MEAFDLRVEVALVILIAAQDKLARGVAGRERYPDLEQVFGRSVAVAQQAAVQWGALGEVDRIALGMAEAEKSEGKRKK